MIIATQVAEQETSLPGFSTFAIVAGIIVAVVPLLAGAAKTYTSGPSLADLAAANAAPPSDPAAAAWVRRAYNRAALEQAKRALRKPRWVVVQGISIILSWVAIAAMISLMILAFADLQFGATVSGPIYALCGVTILLLVVNLLAGRFSRPS